MEAAGVKLLTYLPGLHPSPTNQFSELWKLQGYQPQILGAASLILPESNITIKILKKLMLSKLYRGFSGTIREILVIQIKHNRFKTQPRKLVTMSPIPKEKISVCQITFFDRLQAHEVVLVNALCYGTFYCSNAQFPNVMKLTCIVLLSFFGVMDESILSLASLRLLSRGEWKASW